MPVAKRDYYGVLGVSKNATVDQIKAAYRRLAIQHHPDKNKGDKAAEEKFKEVNEAYEVLSDPKKRSEYDQYGHFDPTAAASASQGGNANGSGGGFYEHRTGPSGFEDFFRDAFGGGGIHFEDFGEQETRQQNLQAEHTISLREAFTGTESRLRFRQPVACSACQGTGVAGGQTTRCPACGGTGRQSGRRGFMQVSQTCSRCGGTGRSGSPCIPCQGQGQVEEEKTVTVRVPAGIRDGATLRVPQNGRDLYLVIHVAKDSRFERDGDDLITEQKISVPVAALGGEAEVNGLDRNVRIRIPAGTQPGTLLRVRGAGMPKLNHSGRGDLLVRIAVEIPARLTREQRRLFSELAGALGERNSTKP